MRGESNPCFLRLCPGRSRKGFFREDSERVSRDGNAWMALAVISFVIRWPAFGSGISTPFRSRKGSDCSNGSQVGKLTPPKNQGGTLRLKAVHPEQVRRRDEQFPHPAEPASRPSEYHWELVSGKSLPRTWALIASYSSIVLPCPVSLHSPVAHSSLPAVPIKCKAFPSHLVMQFLGCHRSHTPVKYF